MINSELVELIKKSKPLNEEEEKALFLEYYETKDEKIKEKIIASNYKFLYKIASNYSKHYNKDIEDLFMQGLIGLYKAFNRYDINRDVKFLSFAFAYIKNEILSSLKLYEFSTGRTNNVTFQLLKYQREKSELEQQFHRFLSLDELSSELNIPIDKIFDFERILNPMLNINDYTNKGLLIDVLPDNGAMDPEKVLIEKDTNRILYEKLSLLKERERKILLLRYGLIDGKRRTLCEVAELLNLTYQRVGQIEKKALYRLNNFLIKENLCEKHLRLELSK